MGHVIRPTLLIVLALLTTSCSEDPSSFSLRGVSDPTTLPSRSVARATTTVGDPASFKVKVYQLLGSTNPDCTDPVLLAGDGSTGEQHDLLTEATLFETLEIGTYACLVIKMSDQVRFSSKTASGACTSADEFTRDHYPVGCATRPDGVWKDSDGNDSPCTGDDANPVENLLYLFASTNRPAVIARGFSPDQVIALPSAAVSPGMVRMTFATKNTVQLDNNGTGLDATDDLCRMSSFAILFQ